MTPLKPQPPQSVLFITLDSCRYDTFETANIPHLRSVGPLYRAMAPSHFTYGSHAAMFVGFTPGQAEVEEPYRNPKYAKFFKMRPQGGFAGLRGALFPLEGRNLADGFRRRGYAAIGTAAMPWFDPKFDTGRTLTADFEQFFFSGQENALRRQLEWLNALLAQEKRPTFVFVNVGETHVPYHYEGASWSAEPNPCVPFGKTNDAAECRRRQTACVEYVDRLMEPLLDAFSEGTVVITADHGDCWGEDGLWEHGFYHKKVLDVPLLYRLGKLPL